MAEHISWIDVILVVFPPLAFGPWEGEMVGPGLETRDSLGGAAGSLPPWLGEGRLPGRTIPLFALSPQPPGLSLFLSRKS